MGAGKKLSQAELAQRLLSLTRLAPKPHLSSKNPE
jgi:hypothetical protein